MRRLQFKPVKINAHPLFYEILERERKKAEAYGVTLSQVQLTKLFVDRNLTLYAKKNRKKR